VAGLLIQAKDKFAGATFAPAEVKTLLTSTATLFPGETGHSTTSGFGLTNADAAMRTIGRPVPTLVSLHQGDLDDIGTLNDIPNPITTGFTLVARGTNLSDNTVIELNGNRLPTTRGTGAFTDLLYAVLANAPPASPVSIKLYTAPMSSSGLDGGYSNEFTSFYTTNKKIINIRANNATRKYGEANPTFTGTITVDGVPVSDAATLQALQLNSVTYTSAATPTSPVYVYPITPQLNTVINAELEAQYQYNLIPGALTVGKLPVKISPANQTFRLGEFITVNYTYDFGGATIDPAVETETAAKHQAQVTPNALAVMRGFTAPGSGLTEADLVNKHYGILPGIEKRPEVYFEWWLPGTGTG
jgi:hypothetical protein